MILGIEFLNEFLKSTDGDSIIGQMLQEILSLQFESIDLTCDSLKNLTSRDYLSLKLFREILKYSIRKNSKIYFLELEKFYNFENNLQSLFNNCHDESTLGLIYLTFFISHYCDYYFKSFMFL